MQKLGAEFLYIPVKKGVVDPSAEYSLESISSKVSRIILPDNNITPERKNKLKEVFGRYAWDKTR